MQKTTAQIQSETATHGQFCDKAGKFMTDKVMEKERQSLRSRLSDVFDKVRTSFSTRNGHITIAFHYKNVWYNCQAEDFKAVQKPTNALPEEYAPFMETYLLAKDRYDREYRSVGAFINRVLCQTPNTALHEDVFKGTPLFAIYEEALGHFLCPELHYNSSYQTQQGPYELTKYDQQALDIIHAHGVRNLSR